jgi:catechol 2,3-dioxygenase-like lactoylglutathione lyase family enzyme
VVPELEAFAGRSIFQIGFVVRDFEGALARYSALLGPGRWRCWTFGARDHARCEYRGGPTDFTSRLALNDQAPQLELIEPLTGPSTHKDWLDERGEGIHHVGVIVASVADAVAEATAAGYEVVQSGAGLGPERDGAWAYIDTSAALGVMVEAVEPPTSMPPVEFTWPAAS